MFMCALTIFNWNFCMLFIGYSDIHFCLLKFFFSINFMCSSIFKSKVGVESFSLNLKFNIFEIDFENNNFKYSIFVPINPFKNTK
jgi:hypothetical protein